MTRAGAPARAARTVQVVSTLERPDEAPIPEAPARAGYRLPDLDAAGLAGVGIVGSLAVRQAGSGPPVLLLHGWCADAVTNWAGAMADLSGFTVVAPDLPGHGASPPPPDGFSIPGAAAMLAETLDELGTGPLLVAGYSMGGPVSQCLARQRPDLVAGLVQVATAARIMPALVTRTVVPAAAQATRLLAEAVATASAVFRQGSDLRGHALGLLRASDKASLAQAASALARHDSRPWVGSLGVDAAVIVTERDRAVPPGAQRELADLLAVPGARRFALPYGHLACLAADFGPCLRAALDELAR